jgi:hypothetical protein
LLDKQEFYTQSEKTHLAAKSFYEESNEQLKSNFNFELWRLTNFVGVIFRITEQALRVFEDI